MKAEITKEQAYNAFLRGHNQLTPDNGTSCALAAHALGKRSGLSCADGVISALQALGFVFEGDQEKPRQVTVIQAYNWLRKYYADSQTTVDIIKTLRGQLAILVSTWEENGDVTPPHLYCQIDNETEHEMIAEMLGHRFPRCFHRVIIEQMAKEPTEVV